MNWDGEPIDDPVTETLAWPGFEILDVPAGPADRR